MYQVIRMEKITKDDNWKTWSKNFRGLMNNLTASYHGIEQFKMALAKSKFHSLMFLCNVIDHNIYLWLS